MTSLSVPLSEAESLLPWLSESTELGVQVRRAIQEDGYYIVRNVLTAEECACEVSRIWDFIETVTCDSVLRDDPNSWFSSKDASGEDGSSSKQARSGRQVDPWPHTGWGSFPDMFQSQQAGWLFSELRTKLAKRIFEPLYGTNKLVLHCPEGFTFHRPTPADGRHPSGLGKRVVSVCGKPCGLSIGEHFDQSAKVQGLRRIQSSVALLDQSTNDGCFVCWPGSHKAHPALIQGTWRGRSDWVPLTDEELATLKEQGFKQKRVPVNAGDVIFWRPDLAHCGASPNGVRTNFRAVVYNCMLPVDYFRQNMDKEATNDCDPSDFMIPGKLKAYLEMKTGAADLPNERRTDLKVQPYFKDGPPRLTWRQAQFYGLTPYLTNGRTRDECKAIAESRGVRFQPET